MCDLCVVICDLGMCGALQVPNGTVWGISEYAAFDESSSRYVVCGVETGGAFRFTSHNFVFIVCFLEVVVTCQCGFI